jgi:hypothetical protein
MNTLLVKDLPSIEDIDRETAKAVRGGNLIIKNPDTPPSWLKLPELPPALPTIEVPLPGHYVPYAKPQDPRLQ